MLMIPEVEEKLPKQHLTRLFGAVITNMTFVFKF